MRETISSSLHPSVQNSRLTCLHWHFQRPFPFKLLTIQATRHFILYISATLHKPIVDHFTNRRWLENIAYTKLPIHLYLYAIFHSFHYVSSGVESLLTSIKGEIVHHQTTEPKAQLRFRFFLALCAFPEWNHPILCPSTLFFPYFYLYSTTIKIIILLAQTL